MGRQGDQGQIDVDIFGMPACSRFCSSRYCGSLLISASSTAMVVRPRSVSAPLSGILDGAGDEQRLLVEVDVAPLESPRAKRRSETVWRCSLESLTGIGLERIGRS
jgi:hypothetical protein